MSKPQQASAFILRKVDYGDQDQIITVFGRENGKFSALARNARASKKRFGGGLQPMRQLRLSYTHAANRSMASLREIEILRDYRGLDASFDKITIASYATELVREFVQEASAEPETFDLLDAFYSDLAAQNISQPTKSSADSALDSSVEPSVYLLEAMLFQFELCLLGIHGALPSLGRCFRCGLGAEEMEKLRCMRTGEGLICGACRRPGEAVGVLSGATAGLLYYLQKPAGTPPEGLCEPGVHQQIRRVLDAALEQVLAGPLNSRVMLDALFL